MAKGAGRKAPRFTLRNGSPARRLDPHSAGVLACADQAEVRAGGSGARFLLLAGRPLGVAVAQHGPFVMNTREEIEQAIRDYQSGELALAPS